MIKTINKTNPVVSGPSQLTYLVVAVDEDDAQVGRLQLAPSLHRHIVPLADVVDVDRDAGVSAWPPDHNTHTTHTAHTHQHFQLHFLTQENRQMELLL